MLKNIFGNRGKQNTKSDNLELEKFLIDAIDLFENGDFEQATERFTIISHMYPEHPLAHLMLGRALIELKQFEKAITALRQHLKLFPSSIEAMIYLGLAYYECGENELAKERFEEALSIKTSSLLAYENLIILKIESNKLDEALSDLIELQKSHPNDRNIAELLILTLGKQGKWEAAKQHIHHSILAQTTS